MKEPGLNLEIQVCHMKDEVISVEIDIKNTGIGCTVWKWQAIQMTTVCDIQQVAI